MTHRWYLQDHEETFLSDANFSQFLEIMRKYEASTTSVHRDDRQKQERLQEGTPGLLRLLRREPSVKSFVADFKSGIWKALRLVFDNPHISGCAFHWGQAVWRKLQEKGLQTTYNQQDAVFKFCRKVFALPLLPAEDIPTTFEKLKGKVKTTTFNEWMMYISDRWISSTIWPIYTWSVFGKTVRRNNDVEGWQSRLNCKTRKNNLQFYLMLTLLYKVAQMIPSQVKMVSEGNLTRHQTKQIHTMHGKLFRIWRKYTNKDISVNNLLRMCRSIYGPRS